MTTEARIDILDQGYVQLVEHWGSDERIVEAARMSTQKGFRGWGQEGGPPGDEKFLKYLWDHQHSTPFEMAGLTIEVKAPIFVLREWHRHRTQSYNEMSARYIPIPNEAYVPSLDRVLQSRTETKNKQAQGLAPLSDEDAENWRSSLEEFYQLVDQIYQQSLTMGVSKELARLVLPVGRYSVMRASANLRNWLAFLKLRCADNAQWEIRQYGYAIARMVEKKFPRTYDVSKTSLGLP